MGLLGNDYTVSLGIEDDYSEGISKFERRLQQLDQAINRLDQHIANGQMSKWDSFSASVQREKLEAEKLLISRRMLTAQMEADDARLSRYTNNWQGLAEALNMVGGVAGRINPMLGRATSWLGDMAGAMGGFSTTGFSAAGMAGLLGVGAAGIAGIAVAYKAAVEAGAPLYDEQQRNIAIGQQYAVSGEEVAQSIYRQANATITYADAVKIASGALLQAKGDLGTPGGNTIGQVRQLFAISQGISKITGVPEQDVFSGIIAGIESGDIGKLDQATNGLLGLSDAMKEYAKSSNIDPSALTDQMRGQIALNLAIQQGEDWLDRNSAALERQTEKLKDASVATRDLKERVLTSLGADPLLTGWSGDVGSFIRGISDFIGGQGKTSREFGQNVSVIEAMIRFGQQRGLSMDMATGMLDKSRGMMATPGAVQYQQEIIALLRSTLGGAFDDFAAAFPETTVAVTDMGTVAREATSGLAGLAAMLEVAANSTDTLITKFTQGAGMFGPLGEDMEGPSATEIYLKSPAHIAYQIQKAQEAAALAAQTAIFRQQYPMQAWGDQRPSYVLASDTAGRTATAQRLQQEEWDRLAQLERERALSAAQRAWAMQSGRIERALMAGRSVTAQDMIDTKAGVYQNKPLEAARQLDAIFERGFAELKAHPDWAEILGIPPEILAGTEAQLKAWAGRTAQAVTDLTRPDLIDWDAFLRQYDQIMADEQMKENTLRFAQGLLENQGYLKGLTPAQKRAKVAAAFGIDDPAATAQMFGGELSAALAAQDVGSTVFGSWAESFDRQKDGFKTIGVAVGKQVSAAFVSAVTEGVGNVRQDLAKILAPEVARYLPKPTGGGPLP